MIRILIADDHKIFRQGLSKLLSPNKGMEVVGTVANGVQVLKFVEENELEVILLDINMPKLNGLVTCEQVLNLKPNIKIIGLTMHDNKSFIQQMLKKGASGFLLKNTDYEELIRAIKTVTKDEIFIGEEINKLLVNDMMGKKKRSSFKPTITRREKEVLEMVFQEMTTPEIAEKLNISINTVETHRKHLISKFGVRSSIGLVKKAIELEIL